jgi:bifunctional ADP-heptose synthase (sugar kinase/adenylyltransferase)
MPLTLERLTEILAKFPKLTIGLVGDLFLDRYLEIEPGETELSIETGLEAYQITRVRNSPGALGTVMNNLAALGVGRLIPATVIGDDGHGYDLLRALSALPVDTSAIVRVADRLTPTYTKPLQPQAQGSPRELNRLDIRTRAPLSDETHAILAAKVREMFTRVDGLIVLDQIVEENWGVVDARMRRLLSELVSLQPDKLVYIDSRANLGLFPFGILKGNRSEYRRALGNDASRDDDTLSDALLALAARTGRPVYCTVGEQGIDVALPRAASLCRAMGYEVPPPIDIVGAGDAATSGIVASLLAGADPLEAAEVGNLVASITVKQLGTTGSASPPQVLARWHECHSGVIQ